MRFDRTAHTKQLLQLLMWAAIVLPVGLFAYATWTNYKTLTAVARERVERTLDVLQEHAQKVFQTIDRTIGETNEVLRDTTDAAIRAGEERLHLRLKQTQQAVPSIEAIWAFDREGSPLVSSTVYPVPKGLNNADRDYFKAQVSQDGGTYIGDVIPARIGNLHFFVVSRRRPSADGLFNGVIGVTVPPEDFRVFFTRLAQGTALSAGLLRADGTILARFPTSGTVQRLPPGNRFVGAVAASPEGGSYTAVSRLDGVERNIAYRKIPGYPVYVQAGLAVDAIWEELGSKMAGHLVFGLPASALLVLLSYLALRQTQEFLDESQRRELAEAALKQGQRLEAVGQLTGGVAHDFNNILMVVNGNVERLRKDLAEPRHRRALDSIDKAARRGADLTRQLLTFSRQQAVAPTVLDLSRRLPKLREMLRSSLRGNITVDLDISDHLWLVKVDPGELELAILNLGINARDAMPDGGSLTLIARNRTLGGGPCVDDPQGDFVMLVVRDSGTGIPADVLPKVFEPFFTTKEVGKGTGLGLSQVYGFAKQAGGTATVASELGRGTEIVIYLPRSLEWPDQEENEAPTVPEHPSDGTILLVEDNAEIADVSKANLEQVGYRVVHAANAEAALEAIGKDRSLDLVFSDIVMPGSLSGLDLARRLRQLRPGLPVILTTGYSAALQSAAPEGFTLLTKPYDLAALRQVIDETLRARGAKVVSLPVRRQE